MPDRPLISLTLIARNEKHNVARCLDSVWPWVDEVCVVDTGSTDGTVAEFKRYAERRREPGKLKTRRFQWVDDFSAARQAADEMATGQWTCWCDLDDEIRGMKKLRELAAEATEDVAAFYIRYSYARDPAGSTISELWRERVVRNDGTPWVGRLHEHKIITRGVVVKVGPDMAEWVHHRDHEQRTGERNIRILDQWLTEEPGNPRVIQSLAMEYMGAERHKDASDMFGQYLECPGEPPDCRAQAFRHLCVMLMLQDRVQEARDRALDALREVWTWPDTHLTLAEAEQTLGRPDVALVHARTALQIGQPDTLLIVNPLQYTAQPRALMAVCLAQMGQWEEAVRVAEECLTVAPGYQLVEQNLPLWRGQLKKQHALGAFLACADVLIETGELLKARALLDQAPWFVTDEERIIRRRAEVWHEIQRRGEQPDALDDDAADAFVERHHQEPVAA